MIFLFELLCPHGHVKGRMPEQYASPNPPEAWLEQMRDDLFGLVRDNPAWRTCDECQSPLSGEWLVRVRATALQSMREAAQILTSGDSPSRSLNQQ